MVEGSGEWKTDPYTNICASHWGRCEIEIVYRVCQGAVGYSLSLLSESVYTGFGAGARGLVSYQMKTREPCL